MKYLNLFLILNAYLFFKGVRVFVTIIVIFKPLYIFAIQSRRPKIFQTVNGNKLVSEGQFGNITQTSQQRKNRFDNQTFFFNQNQNYWIYSCCKYFKIIL